MTKATKQLDPLYYLRNFERALDWLIDHYADLFAPIERQCIEIFKPLPVPSQALLVRMIMRKGPLFRSSRINYPEIGCIKTAADPLIAPHWIDWSLLTLESLFEPLTRAELQVIFNTSPKNLTKPELLVAVRDQSDNAQTFERWRGRNAAVGFGDERGPLRDGLGARIGLMSPSLDRPAS